MGTRRFVYYSEALSSFDPTDLNPLFYWKASENTFQDDMATNPVTADGQTVGSISYPVNSNNYTQTAPLDRPIYRESAINGQPALEFNGSNEFMLGSTALTNIINGEDLPITVSMVVTYDSLVGNPSPISWTNTNNRPFWRYNRALTSTNSFQRVKRDDALVSQSFTYGTAAALTTYVITAIDTGTTVDIWVNGTQVVTGNNSNVGILTMNRAFLGKGTNTAQFHDGLIAEVFIKDGTITSGERTSLDNFLINKYIP